MMFQFRCAVLALAGTVIVAPPVAAQAAGQAPADAQGIRQAIDDLKKEFDARLSALEARLAAVEKPQAVAVPPPPAAAPPTTAAVEPATTGATGGSVSNAKVFNPDIAVIGDFLGAVGKPNTDPANGILPLPLFEMHESEAAFQAVVDPYARADFFISFGEEGVDLEEGYITFTELPGGLLTKVGKFRAAFGKVNTLHNHVLPWTDRPLVTNNLVAGEDGIDDAGISVARLIPNPWFFLEATGQVLRGDSGAEPAVYLDPAKPLELRRPPARLSGSLRIDEHRPRRLGCARLQRLGSAGRRQQLHDELFGVDATVRWKPLQRSIYHSFVGRSE